MAMVGILQQALFKQCRGLRPKALPLVAQLRTSPNGTQLFFVKNCKITVSKLPKCSILPFKVPSYIHFPKEIHTSPQHRAIPPFLWIILRPILNISVIIFGKLFKRWWQKQSPEKRSQFWNRVQENRGNILGTLAALGILGFVYYLFHLELEPLTNRQRFMMLHNKDMEELTDRVIKEMVESHAHSLMPVSHSHYRQVERVMKRIITANRDILVQRNISKLRIYVVGTPDMNAIVFPNSTVIIFEGLFKLCQNDDQLAAVLSHELAHAALNHQAEVMSREQVLDTVMLLVLLLVWATVPDVAAFLWQLLSMSLSQILVKLPFSREMELEADAVGLQFIAKACFDVREAVIVWGKLGYLEEVGLAILPPEIMSTHPPSKKRQEVLESLMPAAMEMRNSNNCSRLPRKDPKITLEGWKRGVDHALGKRKSDQSPGLVIEIPF